MKRSLKNSEKVLLALCGGVVLLVAGWFLWDGYSKRMAAAQDKLFPAVFGRLSDRGVPAVGIVLSAILATALVLVQAAGGPGVRAFYNAIVGLATMTAVVT